MIVAIGIDIIEVARIREVLMRTPRFRERVFTPAEREYCDSRGAVSAQRSLFNPLPSSAGNF
jgi:holo-[acyl-carrier protein] synthase